MSSTSDRISRASSANNAGPEIISLFKSIHGSSPETGISFINVFNELPIATAGRISEIGTDSVAFNVNAIQAAAICSGMEAIIKTPLSDTWIRGKLLDIDKSRGVVTLNNFSYINTHIERRSAVRVRLRTPMNVNFAADGHKVSGVIREISMTGCCVATPAAHVLEKAESIALKLKFFIDNAVSEEQIKSKLIRIEETHTKNCIIKFEHTPSSKQFLSSYINQRQLEIIKELKDHSINW